jgi:hypothetical protein
MADARVERLIASLDAAFDASIARQEEEAADDLAFSLRQDRSLTAAMASGAPLCARMIDGAALPITHVGSDCVRAGLRGEVVIPVTRLVAETAASATASRPKVRGDETMLGIVRRGARAGVSAEIRSGSRVLKGRLIRATPDHIELLGRDGRALVSLEAVDCLTLLGGNGSDAI